MALTVDNTGIKALSLVSLSKIERGDVSIVNNDRLCLADTIVWNSLLHDEAQKYTVDNASDEYCSQCSTTSHPVDSTPLSMTRFSGCHFSEFL